MIFFLLLVSAPFPFVKLPYPLTSAGCKYKYFLRNRPIFAFEPNYVIQGIQNDIFYDFDKT